MLTTIHSRRIKLEAGGQTCVPIKDKETVNAIFSNLELKKEKARTEVKRYQAQRNYLLFAVGISTAFRAEDLLQLRVKDFYGGYVRYVFISENKTGKRQNFPLSSKLKSLIDSYVERWKLNDHDYLFLGQVRKQHGQDYSFPITRQRAYNLVRGWGRAVGIHSHFGIHSLRKTFAYFFYSEGHDLLTLSRLLNHSSTNTTLRYICWADSDVVKARKSIDLLP